MSDARGPWLVFDSDGDIYTDDDPFTVEIARDDGATVVPARQAAAAPALVAACKQLRDLESWESGRCSYCGAACQHDDDSKCPVHMAGAALAAAGEETP